MLSKSVITVALAGAAAAFTPAGFQPSANGSLIVAFGNTLAVNGVDLPKDTTQTAPTVGTTERLTGTYTLMMVDPDIPPKTEGGETSELLHWMQTDLVSANTTTTIGGMKVFELTNPTNTKALASYLGPAPPNKSPQSHRYTQILFQSPAGNSTSLASFARNRANFSAVNVVRSAGVTLIAGNSFNVTASNQTTGIGQGNSTIPAPALATGTGTTSAGTAGNTSSSTLPNAAVKAGSGALLAGLCALAAAVVIL